MKTSERKARFLERQCFKNASRAHNREEFLQLEIQTCSPFERVFVFGVGVVVAAFAIWIFLSREEIIATVIVGAIALLLMLIGLRGRKKMVSTVFRGLDATITTSILDAIF